MLRAYLFSLASRTSSSSALTMQSTRSLGTIGASRSGSTRLSLETRQTTVISLLSNIDNFKIVGHSFTTIFYLATIRSRCSSRSTGSNWSLSSSSSGSTRHTTLSLENDTETVNTISLAATIFCLFMFFLFNFRQTPSAFIHFKSSLSHPEN